MAEKKETFHEMPADFRKALNSDKEVKEKWNSITPMARNEFVCKVLSAKQEATRAKRIQRNCEDLMNGKRRPCCWPGCPHRNPNSQKYFK